MADMIERCAVLLALNQDFQNQVNKLQADGWDLNPEAPPVAIYHLQRRTQHPVGAGHGGVAIDDTKVHVIKGNGSVPG